MNVETIHEPARNTPVLARPDVLVVGGGIAGLAAAASAARAGASTLLIEQHGFLGGTLSAVTLGGLCGSYRQVDGELRPVVGGWWRELESRLRAADALGVPRKSTIVRGVHGIPYDPERLKHVADEWMADTGVDVLTGVLLADVLCEARRVNGVLVQTVEGRRAIVPQVVIDASGDAALIAAAFDEINGGMNSGTHGDTDSGTTGVSLAREGHLQSPSAMFRMAPVDRVAFGALSRLDLTRLLAEANDAANATDATAVRAPLPRTTVAVFPYMAQGEMHLNATRVARKDGRWYDITQVRERAEAEREGRRQVFDYERVFRERVAGFGNARVTAMGAMLGVRESRRIHGDAELTEIDVMSGHKPAERIACCAWPVEDHAPGHETVWRPLPDGDWYGIAYGCLLPRNLDNVIAAGRCLSATHVAQASARISGACLAMGEAAGIAAALALNKNNNVRIDVTRLQQALRDHGAILDPQ